MSGCIMDRVSAALFRAVVGSHFAPKSIHLTPVFGISWMEVGSEESWESHWLVKFTIPENWVVFVCRTVNVFDSITKIVPYRGVTSAVV